MADADKERLLAAQAAVRYVRDGMCLGLGTGSTASHAIRLIGERIRQEGLKLRAVPTSRRSEELARQVGIPLVTLSEVRALDLAIDGADEVDLRFRAIKGAGGGAILHERVVASASAQFIIIADSSKQVDAIGKVPVPVEVLRFAWPVVAERLARLGATPVLRQAAGAPFLTDEQNFILDCRFPSLEDPEAVADALRRTPGVVDHGLFLGYPDVVIFGRGEGVEIHPVPGARRER